MVSMEKIQALELPSPHSATSFENLDSSVDSPESQHGPDFPGYGTSDQQPQSGIVTLAHEFRRLSTEIQNLSNCLSVKQRYGWESAIREDSQQVNTEPNAEPVVDAEFAVGFNSTFQPTIFASRKNCDLRYLEAFWTSHCPNKNECSDLLTIFIDFVHYGRLSRDIGGITSRFNPSVGDDLSTTNLVFGHRESNGGTRRQPISWAPPDAIVAVRGSWEAINQHIWEAWPSSLKPPDDTQDNTSGRYPDDFAYGWNLNHGASVDSTRFSYYKDGSPKILTASFQAALTYWNETFGRRWSICIEDPVMNFTLLALIACRVTLGHDVEFEDVGYLGLAFARRFAGEWPETRWTKWCCVGRTRCHMQFHIRYLATSAAVSATTPSYTADGLLVQRQRGTVDLTNGPGDFEIRESRMATAIITAIDTNWAPYSVVTLTESENSRPENLYGQKVWHDMCSELNISRCDNFKGIAMFQVEIYQTLLEWSRRWNIALHHIGNMARIDDVLDSTRLAALKSVDNSQILGLLHTSSRWIREAMADLKSLQEDFIVSVPAAPKVVFANWKALVLYQDRVGQQLSQRIENKIVEVTNLTRVARLK